MTTDNVTPFRPREPLDETTRQLHIAMPTLRQCRHRRYNVDERLATVTCRDCGEQLNPVRVLVDLARDESLYIRRHAQYVEEVERLQQRSRTKCQHCQRITRISTT